MQKEPKLWNVGLIILVVAIGFFLPGGEQQPRTGSTSTVKPVEKKNDPSKTVVVKDSSGAGGQMVAATNDPTKKGAKAKSGGPKTDEEKAEEWDKLVDAQAAEFDAQHKKLEGEPVVDPKWVDEDFTREEIEKSLARAETQYQREGQLHTLPAEEREAKLARIREAAYELQYNPDNAELHVRHAMALEDAQLHSPAFNSMAYAFRKFPESSETATAYGDLGAKWSLRHVAEVGYERALQIEPGNERAKAGLESASKMEYHPGYVAMGWIPEDRLKNSNKGE